MKTVRIFVSMFAMFAAVLYGCKKDANNDPGNPYNGKTFAIFNPDKTYGTLTDQDGNIYKTITIGTQTWMAENLRTTTYRNGEAIPRINGNSEWAGLSTGAFCNFNNTENIDTIATFGRLYNWYIIADVRQLAPNGWHIPTDEEWTTLITFLGGEFVAGGKMKEKEAPHWSEPDPNATNESGFTALPAGMREVSTSLYSYNCNFWSSTQADNASSWDRYLNVGEDGCLRYNPNKSYGFSIRCLKD
jgi:uncharacterized protein (TIGR02145 family)